MLLLPRDSCSSSDYAENCHVQIHILHVQNNTRPLKVDAQTQHGVKSHSKGENSLWLLFILDGPGSTAAVACWPPPAALLQENTVHRYCYLCWYHRATARQGRCRAVRAVHAVVAASRRLQQPSSTANPSREAARRPARPPAHGSGTQVSCPGWGRGGTGRCGP